jgi:signal transduction histidine kinase
LPFADCFPEWREGIIKSAIGNWQSTIYMIRHKPFLTYFLLCAVPLLLLATLNYWNGIRTIDSTMKTVVRNDLTSLNVAVDEVLREADGTILRLAINSNIQGLAADRSDAASRSIIPHFIRHFQSVTLYDRNRQPLWFRTREAEWKSWDSATERNRPSSFPQPDPRVWATQGNELLTGSGVSTTPALEYTVPVHDQTAGNVGALVGVLDLESVFSSAAKGLESRSNRDSIVIVLDRSEKIIHHSDRLLRDRAATEALPGFDSIAMSMMSKHDGFDNFSSAGSNYIAAYSTLPRLNVALAVARNQSKLMSSAHSWGITGLATALLAALAAAFVLDRYVQKRTRSIARVSEDLSAIAKGELDRRIILQSSDDARGLADNINVVTERLRAQIAREEESRQFESFIRLSAMLTHDLKNAIESLSLTVGNMERHFDNPEFRTDALKGLTSATDKLKAIVARLARPLTSLSGEHKRPTNVDLVPILKRVIAMTAEPSRNKHKIVTRLPPSLYALVDPARIEEVIENLLLNALEAMSEKSGTLTIEAGLTDKGAPSFSISDTGQGMSKSFIESRLFRPFSTTKRTGIGLGLYTCREVIQASAGSIEVESVEGAGTTFRVVLPSIPHDRRN